MQEITKLTIERHRLPEKHFYYNGVETANTKEAEAATDEIINLAADVLIKILEAELQKE